MSHFSSNPLSMFNSFNLFSTSWLILFVRCAKQIWQIIRPRKTTQEILNAIISNAKLIII